MDVPFYIYAFIGAVASGLIVITAKLTSKHSIKDPWVFFIVMTLITLLMVIPPALINGAGLPVDWWPIIAAGIFSQAFNITWLFSTYALDVTVFSPLFSFRGIFAVLIGALFLGENLNSFQLIMVAVIIIAGVFTTVDERMNLKAFFTKKIALAILTTLLLAITNSFVKVAQINNSLWTTNLWIALISVGLTIPLLLKYSKPIRVLSVKQVAPVFLLGVFTIVTDFTANAAYAVNVGVSSLIMNIPFSMLIALILAYFAPNLLEKHSRKIYIIRSISALIMIVCSILLATGNN